MSTVAHNPAARVAFRVDASREIGAGHVMRCLALAQALGDAGFESTFVCAQLPEALEPPLRAQRVSLLRIAENSEPATDADHTLAALRGGSPPECLVVDHYGLDAAWESRARAGAARILAIDDLADRRHDADWLLDQNLQDGPRRYDGLLPANCRSLLGPRFALLRPEFARLRASAAPLAQRTRVVLSAGAGDVGNATGRVLEAWWHVPAPRPALDVVIGAMHPEIEAIRSQCATLPEVTLHVQTDRMADLLSAARLLIGTTGTISWERCCLGVPALMFSTADNQLSNLRLLAARRTGISLGDIHGLESIALARIIARVLARPSLLERWSKRASALVDGLGARRVAVLLAAGALQLRPAAAADAAASWNWRNDLRTRRFSRDSREIPFEHHEAWWLRALEDPRRHIFIARCSAMDVGVLRLDESGDEAEISIYLDPALNGLGLGTAMLRAAQREVLARLPRLARLRAFILPENRASESAFTRAGFRRDGETWTWSAAERIESKVSES